MNARLEVPRPRAIGLGAEHDARRPTRKAFGGLPLVDVDLVSLGRLRDPLRRRAAAERGPRVLGMQVRDAVEIGARQDERGDARRRLEVEEERCRASTRLGSGGGGSGTWRRPKPRL